MGGVSRARLNRDAGRDTKSPSTSINSKAPCSVRRARGPCLTGVHHCLIMVCIPLTSGIQLKTLGMWLCSLLGVWQPRL